MTWRRALVAPALADVLKAAQVEGDTASIFSAPPETLNAPAIVVGRPIEVRYAVAGLGVDEADLPVICLAQMLAGEDAVDGLIAFVRAAVAPEPSLNGAVRICTATLERNWRAVRIGGADMMAADVVLTIQT